VLLNNNDRLKLVLLLNRNLVEVLNFYPRPPGTFDKRFYMLPGELSGEVISENVVLKGVVYKIIHMNKIRLITLAVAAIFALNTGNAFGQGMAVNTSGSAADASAILDASSSTQGMLVPRMTDIQRTGISNPATGLLVYQTNGTPGFYYNSGTPGVPAWVSLNALSNVTTQGNTFNGNNQLVQVNGSGQLPALNGAALTSLSGGNITNSTVTVGKISATGTPGATTFLNGSGAWSTPLTLTTTGSGAATFTGGVLNIPTPSSGGGGGSSSATVVLEATGNSGQTLTATGAGTGNIVVNFNSMVTSPSPTVATFTSGTTFKAVQAGVYAITIGLCSTGSTLAAMQPAITVGGKVYFGGNGQSNTNHTPVNRSGGCFIVYMNVDDELQVHAYNASTANAINLSTDGTTRLLIVKL